MAPTNNTEPTVFETDDTPVPQKRNPYIWVEIVFTLVAFYYLFKLGDIIIRRIDVAKPKQPGEPWAFDWKLFGIATAVYFATFASALCFVQALARLMKYMRRAPVVEKDTFVDENLLEKGLN